MFLADAVGDEPRPVGGHAPLRHEEVAVFEE
jgi:hypothetical protein